MKSLASLLLVALALPLAACAGAADEDATAGNDSEESSTEDALTSGRYHFNVGNPSAAWNPGCG